MRLLALLSCLLLGACSSSEVFDLPPNYAPNPAKAIEGAKIGANEEKLAGAIEFSATREAYPLGPGPYILCIRGPDSKGGLRTYAVFFKNDVYVSVRISVLIDHCETEAFAPLGLGPFTDVKMPPPQEPRRI
jgi:hypothetical protein